MAITVKIGRDPQKNDIVLDSGTVSRAHCLITKDDNQRYKLTDTSTNGTWVGDKLIKGKSVYLLPGDVVRIGKVKLPYLSYFNASDVLEPHAKEDDISVESIAKKLIAGHAGWNDRELQFQKNNAQEIEKYVRLAQQNEPQPTPVKPVPKPTSPSEVESEINVDYDSEYDTMKHSVLNPLKSLFQKVCAQKKHSNTDRISGEIFDYALDDYNSKFKELLDMLNVVSKKSLYVQNKYEEDILQLENLRLRKTLANAALLEISDLERRKVKISTLFDSLKSETEQLWTETTELFTQKHLLPTENLLPTLYVGKENMQFPLFAKSVCVSKYEFQSVIDTQNMVLRYDSATKQKCLDFVNTLTGRMLAESKPGKLSIRMIDAEGLDGTCPEFRRLNKSMFGIYTREEEIYSLLESQLRHTENVIQNILHDKAHSLADFNRDRENQEAYRLLVIEGFPAGMSQRSIGLLKKLMKNGVRAGVNVLLLIDEDEIAQTDENANTYKSIEPFLENENVPIYNFVLRQYPSSYRGSTSDITFEKFSSEQLTDIVKKINRRFEQKSDDVLKYTDYLIPESDWWSHSSANYIDIPFGLSEEKELVRLFITQQSGQNSAVVIGIPGSGKSVFLHSVIANAIVNYSPDELELYLMDFSGVEFDTYARHNLPHAKVIAPEAEREFGLSVLKELKEEGARRMELCRKHEVKDIVELRTKCPELKVPRLLVIIDEFQKLFEIEADAISREAQSIIHVIIKEFRKFGINLILATQKLSDINSSILPKDLVANRVVFKCSPSDIGLIGMNAVPQLRTGECIYNCESGVAFANKKVQTFLITQRETDDLLTQVKEYGDSRDYTAKEPIIFRSGDLPAFQKPDIEPQTQPDEVDVYFGQPIAISEYDVCANLRKSSNDNILIIGGEEAVAQKIAINSTMSVMASYADKAAKWYFFNFMRLGDPLYSIPSYYAETPFDTVFASKASEVTEALQAIKIEIDARKADENRAQQHIYLSFYAFQLAQMFKKGGRRGDDVSEDGQILAYILNNGPLVGVFIILQVDNAANLSHLGDVVSLFTHRVALQMDERDSGKIVGSDIASRLYVMNRPSSKYRAYYFNNKNRVLVKFKPYKVWTE